MVLSRMLAILAAALSCLSTGCLSIHSKRPVEVVVTSVETGQPVAGVPVSVNYIAMLVLNIPDSVEGVTNERGRVILQMADFERGPIHLQAGDFSRTINPEMVRKGGDATALAPGADPARKPSVIVHLVPQHRSLPNRLFGIPLGSERKKTSVADVEQKIDGALPVGSTRQDIEKWLAGQNISYSFSDLPFLESTTVNRLPDADNYAGVISGIIRDTDRSIFVTGNIQLHFVLGADGRLSRRLVTWIGSGL